MVAQTSTLMASVNPNVVKPFLNREVPRSFKEHHSPFNNVRNLRNFIYSRYRCLKMIDVRVNNDLTCCKFSTCGQKLFLAASDGTIKVFRFAKNIWKEESCTDCHFTEISNCDVSPKDSSSQLLLTSTYKFPYDSSLWNYTGVFEKQYGFRLEHHVEFCKSSTQKIIGSENKNTANIFDTETGTKVLTLCGVNSVDDTLRSCCQNSLNKATFDPTDNLVLSNRILWDVRSARRIHFFQSLCQEYGGKFHPNGHELISSSFVWDTRMFRLVRVASALHQCKVKFTKSGDVMYGIVPNPYQEMSIEAARFNSDGSFYFRTVDAYDYSSIYTVSLSRANIDLEMSQQYLAAIQYESMTQLDKNGPIYNTYKSYTASVCRLFEIGCLSTNELEVKAIRCDL